MPYYDSMPCVSSDSLFVCFYEDTVYTGTGLPSHIRTLCDCWSFVCICRSVYKLRNGNGQNWRSSGNRLKLNEKLMTDNNALDNKIIASEFSPRSLGTPTWKYNRFSYLIVASTIISSTSSSLSSSASLPKSWSFQYYTVLRRCWWFQKCSSSEVPISRSSFQRSACRTTWTSRGKYYYNTSL